VFDPNYPTNGFFYITYTTNNNNPTFIYTTTLARYHVSSGNPDLADSTSGTVLLSIPKKYTNHNGGMIAFGPDGYLYMSMGDGGNGGDPDNNGQNLHTMLGKILRLDVESTPPVGQKYVIPPTNPFFTSGDPSVKKEIWAQGLRNPWRFSFDRSTGDLYIGDVGQNIEEEVDFQSHASAGGENYGWHILEGNLCYDPSSNCTAPSNYAPPVTTYDHGNSDSVGCAVTGGYVYRGSAFPSLQGVYFFGDYCSGNIWGLIKNPNNTWTKNLIVSTNFLISSFGQDELGELYLADYSAGMVYQIASRRINISGNLGVAGATLSYTDGTPMTAMSQMDGSYSISVPDGWSGTVTPSLECYTFTPLNRTYNSISTDQTAQDYTFTINSSPGCVNIAVTIGGINRGNYGVPSQGSMRVNFAGLDSGPAMVQSSGAVQIISALRDAWAANGMTTSFAQLMGLPDGQLSDTYYFPAYNNVTLNEQLRIGNVDSSPTTVTVTIGGVVRGTYPLAANESVRANYAGLDSGPVVIQASPSVHIIAAERDAWAANGTTKSFIQVMGLPAGGLSDTYYFPAYNNVTLNEQLRIGNVGSGPTTVTVTIGGMVRGTYPLAANESVRVNYDGLDSGPVIVQASPSVHIIAAERDAWAANGVTTSFAQLMGLPAGGLSDTYLFPAYNNVTLNEQLRIGNVGGSATTVTVTIGGVVRGTYPLADSESVRVNYDGLDGGPVVVHAAPSVHIIAAERDAWAANGTTTSFTQLMGLPDSQLSDTYLFPAYNNVTLNEQLRFGVP
jgi:hypothetical protein